MGEYINRMKKLGFKTHAAVRIYECFKSYIDIKHLNDLVNDLESEDYVAQIQSESLR